MEIWYMEDEICPQCAAHMATDGVTKWCSEGCQPVVIPKPAKVDKLDYHPLDHAEVMAGRNPHLCLTCGEKDPRKFHRTMKSKCKKCHTLYQRQRVAEAGTVPRPCTKCGKPRDIQAIWDRRKRDTGMCKSCAGKIARQKILERTQG